MRIAVDPTDDGGWVVTVVGDIDRSSVAPLAQELGRLAGNHLASVVVDLSGCAFIDSSGLSALVVADRALRDSGRRLELIVPAFVLRLLEATELDTLFAIVVASTGEEAPRGGSVGRDPPMRDG